MAKRKRAHLSKQLAKRIRSLTGTRKEHLKLLGEILSADNGNLFEVDLVILAVMQRSWSLIDGFVAMLESRNLLCAAPLIRLQIDSIMRLYACCLVDDPQSIALKLLQGAPLKKTKSRDGHPLTDRYLHERVSDIFPWVSRVYRKTSGFIHLSRPHMVAPITSIHEDDRALEMSVGNLAPKWSDHEMVEAIDAFTEATKALLQLCSSWLATKEKVARERAEAKGGPPASD